MKIRIFLILTLLILSSATHVQAGWPQPKGQAFFKFNLFSLRASSYYNGLGEVIPITTTGLYTASLYAEYGATDRLTLITYLPLSRSVLNSIEDANGNLLQEGDEITTIGDTDIGLRYQLWKRNNFVLSTSLLLGLPLGNPSGGRTQLLQTGDGEFNQLISLETGYSLYPLPAYVKASVGYNNRTQGFSNEFRYNLEGGLTVKKRIHAIARLYSVAPLGSSNNEIEITNGVFSNRVQFMAFSPELSYEFKEKLGVSLSYGTAFSAKRILAAPSYSIGFYLKVK